MLEEHNYSAVLGEQRYAGLVRPKKINNMFLRHFFLENDAGGRLFILIFLNKMLKNDVSE